MHIMELDFMTSHGYNHGLVLPEQPIIRTSKEYQQLLPSFMSRQDMLKSCSLYTESYQVEDWKPMTQQFKGVRQFTEIDKAIRKHVLNGVKADTHPNSILLSLGIARQIARHESIIKLLTSDSSEIERAELDLSVLSELLELQALTDMPQEPFILESQFCSCDVECQPSLIYPVGKNCFQKPLLGMAKNMYHESDFLCEPDRQLSFINNGTRLQGTLPNILEFGSEKSSTKFERHSLLVPYFERKKSKTSKVGSPGSSLNLETMAPLKSPDKTKAKESLKKKINRKSEKETDMHNNNLVRACESLLSIMIDKKREGKTAIQSLKKTGPELPHVLSQVSAAIAGTGIAVLFGVISKVAYSSTPFCASKLLSTGLGVGFIWLSSAVNRLRDTIISISKRSSKADHKEEDMVKVLDESIKQIYFRAAALLAIIVLKVA